ncbi:hypothetical protein [Flavobacterium cerinum]|uniref:Uncharacterized protein n=1 Tax=Flavobacterium cerinum TaxID=2502784 RepID=A0ABY5ISE1_9FLAO|nr:hypothetical protein [Flavobacterium cerinum]UUC45569.1 hypothetical protein NOX80_18355 [Flavobacterium cerinum]
MKTEENTPTIQPLTNLVSMTDFVTYFQNRSIRQLCEMYPRIFNYIAFKCNNEIGDFNRVEVAKWELIGNYAKFLKQPLKLEMFLPVDKNGDYQTKPIMMESDGFEGVCWSYEDYKAAEKKILFKDFRISTEEESKIGFASFYFGEIICLTNGNTTIPFFPNHTLLVDFLTIVDTVHANILQGSGKENDSKIELTDTALKQIFGHAGY